MPPRDLRTVPDLSRPKTCAGIFICGLKLWVSEHVFKNVMSAYEELFIAATAPKKETAKEKKERYPSKAGEFASY